MELTFTKMSGAGNDFIVLGPTPASLDEAGAAQLARRWCRRGLGIGADGLLLVEPVAPGHVRSTYYNPDGSVAFCGNATRCAARFAVWRGWADRLVTVETPLGALRAGVEGTQVWVELPPPEVGEVLRLEVEGAPREAIRVQAGVPHLVLWVQDVEAAPLHQWGPELRRHPALGPAGANVDVVSGGPEGPFRVRTWERGVEGETLACGSAAVAVAGAVWARGGPDGVTVLPRSGRTILVERAGAGARVVTMTGEATFVFHDARISPEVP